MAREKNVVFMLVNSAESPLTRLRNFILLISMFLQLSYCFRKPVIYWKSQTMPIIRCWKNLKIKKRNSGRSTWYHPDRFFRRFRAPSGVFMYVFFHYIRVSKDYMIIENKKKHWYENKRRPVYWQHKSKP